MKSAADRDPGREIISQALNMLRRAYLLEGLSTYDIAARMQVASWRIREVWASGKDMKLSSLGRIAHAMNKRVIILLVPDEGPPYVADIWKLKKGTKNLDAKRKKFHQRRKRELDAKARRNKDAG